jgi:cysteine-rich repeat protein
MRFTYSLLLSIALAACAGQPDATECKTGITCPEGTKCAAAQDVCINNDCGDGIVQSNELCDDGNILDGDGCAANCASRELCGDGTLNAAAGELCDDGNTIGGDGCADDCRSVEICGNGVRDVNEACDDGNTVPGDGCSGNCKSTEICGNSIVDINEKCDDGATPGG